MSNTNNELHDEQQRVRRTVELIQSRLEAVQREAGSIHGEVVDIRRNFWDDVTVNFEDAAETAETYASMKQQAEVLSERERRQRHLASQLQTLKKLERVPYFGRIDVKDEGEETSDAIYLGIGSLLDDSGEHYLVYDWRAPISSVYYDYGPGPVKYETPSGTVYGEMTLKRQFIIRNGVITSMFDTGLTIGDELLQEVLGQASDSQMKSIVATIQQEQNRIIRNERAKLLIVQGAAGSGKTSAALQRIAYLLYRYRGTLSAEQIVLFSPNPMFNSYISTVLPELGEQNMGQTTYQQYLEIRLGRRFALEDPFTQMEYTLTAHYDSGYSARIEGIRYKSGLSFMRLIDAYAERLKLEGMAFAPVRFRGRTIIAAEAIAEQFYGMEASLSIPNRIRKVAEWMLKELSRLGKLERKKKWVDEQIELLDKDAYVEAFQTLRQKNKYNDSSFDDYDAERDFLAAQVVQTHFKKLRRQAKRLSFVDMPKLYSSLLGMDRGRAQELLPDGEELPALWEQLNRSSLQSLNEGVMPYEDATPYLYLAEKLEGFHTNTSVRHVFVDEAQDYSPFQYQYLKKIFPHARMTVLGDGNQSIFAHSAGMDGFGALSQLFGEAETERIVLERSYRSTRQISAFTSAILADGDKIVPFNRNGLEPSITEATSEDGIAAAIADELKRLTEKGFRSIAVICKTAEESRAMHEKLAGRRAQLKLIEKETVTFEEGAAVIPAYLAKGVEFDAVLLADASRERYSRESERKLFYTACTRAMHELHLFYRGELTPFLDATFG